MRRVRRGLRRDARGASAVEFALAVPILLGFVLGIAQLGLLFFAEADLRNAVAAGARHASIYPRPADEAVIARISAKVAGLKPERIEGPNIVHGVDGDGRDYADIEMGYEMPLNFLLFETPPVPLREVRRVYTQPEAE